MLINFAMNYSHTAGCGVNVSNKHPTISVNDCIALYNSESGSSLHPLTVEQMFLLQHIVALSVVSAVWVVPGYEVVVKHSLCSLVFATSACRNSIIYYALFKDSVQYLKDF